MADTINLQRVVDAPDFAKDPVSGALINTNRKALEAYKARRNKDKELTELKDKVNALENKLDAIIAMLTENKQ